MYYLMSIVSKTNKHVCNYIDFLKIITRFSYFVHTQLLFCDSCKKCDGYINCPSNRPHDEDNCPQQCPSNRTNPCGCNKLGDMTCEGNTFVCYSDKGNILLFMF